MTAVRILAFLLMAWGTHAQSIAVSGDGPDKAPAGSDDAGVVTLDTKVIVRALPAEGKLQPGTVKAVGASKCTGELWIGSSLAVYAAAALDMHATEETARRVRGCISNIRDFRWTTRLKQTRLLGRF